MANDAYIAGVAALLGVGLSGGVQTWIAVRKDRRERRRAVRLVVNELDNYVSVLRHAELNAPKWRHRYLQGLEAPVVFPAEQDALARELSSRHWRLVSGAYRAQDGIRKTVELDTQHRELLDADETPGVQLPTPRMVVSAADAISKASRALAPLHLRPAVALREARRRRSPEGRRLEAIRVENRNPDA